MFSLRFLAIAAVLLLDFLDVDIGLSLNLLVVATALLLDFQRCCLSYSLTESYTLSLQQLLAFCS